MSTYQGDPCKNCQNTLRYLANRSCVQCTRDRSRSQSEVPGGQFEGDPCKRCGNTLRYNKFKRCVTCTKAKRRKRYLKKKEKEGDKIK